MQATRILKALVITAALPLLYLADVTPDAPMGLTLVPEAQAVVGAPLSPLSVAGVARRSTVRASSTSTAAASQEQAAIAAQQQATAEQQAAVAAQQQATAEQQAAAQEQEQAAAARPAGAPAIGTIVNTLPDGCAAEVQGGVEYQNCGGVYYRAAFQGNNLIYVVQ